MLKKLDILIIKAFIGPFIATFFITVLVLLMQFFWLWVDDFVGKGISTDVLFEFIWYQSAVLVPLALPLAILLSSIMTFGNLGESYELVAIKSSGISLLRFMRPLFILTIFICGIAFAFSNNIIPVATLKSRTLLYDIVHANPSFDLEEGVFYDKIPGFSIKVGKKENDTTKSSAPAGGAAFDRSFSASKTPKSLFFRNLAGSQMCKRPVWPYNVRKGGGGGGLVSP